MIASRRQFLAQLGASTAGVAWLALAPGCRSMRGGTNSSGLPRSTPEAQGVSSDAIRAFVEAAQARHEMHSFVLVRHGRVVAEGWWEPYGPAFNHTLYSMSKSFTSTAVGLAVSEGRLTVNDKVVSFFPDESPKTVSENLAGLRVRDLLSMSVGDEKEPTGAMVHEEDWVRSFLAAPITHAPGSTFMYNSGATYMCSAIVQHVTGQRVIDYLRPRLFEPLAIEGMTWETCPRGINVGGWGLSVPTEALAKFGQLYLQKGVWQGRQLIPAAWVAEATTFKIQQPLPAQPARPNERNDWLQGYCYQFWRCTHNAFRGDGAFGQFTIVMPEQDAVLAITSETKDMQGELDLVWEHLLPAFGDRPLPEDRSAHARLADLVKSLALRGAEGKPASPTTSRVSGKRFALQTNELGLASVTVSVQPDQAVVRFDEAPSEYTLACGFTEWQRGTTTLPGTPPRLGSGGAPPRGTPAKVAGRCGWKDDDTLQLVLRYYETPHHDTVSCRFDGDTVAINFMSSIAAMSATPKDNRPTLTGRLVG